MSSSHRCLRIKSVAELTKYSTIAAKPLIKCHQVYTIIEGMIHHVAMAICVAFYAREQ
jgi:hypothetical protein